MGFVLALIGVKGRAGLADFTDEALRDELNVRDALVRIH